MNLACGWSKRVAAILPKACSGGGRSGVSLRPATFQGLSGLAYAAVPASWQQAVEVFVDGGGQRGHDIDEPRIRGRTDGLGGSEQSHDGSGALVCVFGAGKEPILAADRDRPHSVFCRAVVDRVAAIVGDTRERRFIDMQHGAASAWVRSASRRACSAEPARPIHSASVVSFIAMPRRALSP